jgi:hypothetical protein
MYWNVVVIIKLYANRKLHNTELTTLSYHGSQFEGNKIAHAAACAFASEQLGHPAAREPLSSISISFTKVLNKELLSGDTL